MYEFWGHTIQPITLSVPKVYQMARKWVKSWRNVTHFNGMFMVQQEVCRTHKVRKVMEIQPLRHSWAKEHHDVDVIVSTFNGNVLPCGLEQRWAWGQTEQVKDHLSHSGCGVTKESWPGWWPQNKSETDGGLFQAPAPSWCDHEGQMLPWEQWALWKLATKTCIRWFHRSWDNNDSKQFLLIQGPLNLSPPCNLVYSALEYEWAALRQIPISWQRH